MKRYRLFQGKLREHAEGEWVKAEGAEEDVERLNLELAQGRFSSGVAAACTYCSGGAHAMLTELKRLRAIVNTLHVTEAADKTEGKKQ